jgi:hypothetical protein
MLICLCRSRSVLKRLDKYLETKENIGNLLTTSGLCCDNRYAQWITRTLRVGHQADAATRRPREHARLAQGWLTALLDRYEESHNLPQYNLIDILTP